MEGKGGGEGKGRGRGREGKGKGKGREGKERKGKERKGRREEGEKRVLNSQTCPSNASLLRSVPADPCHWISLVMTTKCFDASLSTIVVMALSPCPTFICILNFNVTEFFLLKGKKGSTYIQTLLIE